MGASGLSIDSHLTLLHSVFIPKNLSTSLQIGFQGHIYLLWWLILCVNLTGLRDAQITDKTLFLGVSMRVFLEEISIYSVEWIKSSTLNNGGHHLILWRPKWNKKAEERQIFFFFLFFFELGHPSSPALRHQLSWFSRFLLQTGSYTAAPQPWVLRPWDSDWNIPLAFLALQLADGRLWDF